MDPVRLLLMVVSVTTLAVPFTQMPATSGPANIAHRGASAYAPEHTAAAYHLAIAQGADYVEQDLALTRDRRLVSIHDATLERTTDVEAVFPDRFRLDAKGQQRWFVFDFTLAEIKQLDAGSWFDAKFAGERILTWDEAVEVVGRRAGLYPELKTPELYREQGMNTAEIFAEALAASRFDLTTPIGGRPPLVLQSFDEQATRDAARLLPSVPRTLLVSDGTAERWLSSPERLREVARFATGVGPAKQIVSRTPAIVAWAHAAGLTVTPYTFRASDMGAFADVTAEMAHFLDVFGVDALFTDNPDRFPRRRSDR